MFVFLTCGGVAASAAAAGGDILVEVPENSSGMGAEPGPYSRARDAAMLA